MKTQRRRASGIQAEGRFVVFPAFVSRPTERAEVSMPSSEGGVP